MSGVQVLQGALLPKIKPENYATYAKIAAMLQISGKIFVFAAYCFGQVKFEY